MCRERMYRIWSGLKSRCTNHNAKDYRYYGGRGITVCARWEKFENFYNDMKGGYDDCLLLDRIDNDSGYEPDNCRWVTPRESNLNRRGSIVEVDVKELSSRTGLSESLIRYRIRAGWPIDMLAAPATHSHSGSGLNGRRVYKRKYKEDQCEVLTKCVGMGKSSSCVFGGITVGAISQEIIEVLREKLPDFFPRSRVEELTNGLLSQGRMYNLDRANKGPRAHRMGRQVCYLRDEFVDWLINHYRGMSDEYSNPRTEVHRSAATEDGA